MPLQPLVYEGPDLEKLLHEIVSVHGANVRLGEPTKVRKGGVGGFFATVNYRVEVHLDPVGEPPLAGSPSAAVPPAVETPQFAAPPPFVASPDVAPRQPISAAPEPPPAPVQHLAPQHQQLAPLPQQHFAPQRSPQPQHAPLPQQHFAPQRSPQPQQPQSPPRQQQPAAPQPAAQQLASQPAATSQASSRLGGDATNTIDALEALAAGTTDVFEVTTPAVAHPRSFDDALAAAAASLGDDPQGPSYLFEDRDDLVLANPGYGTLADADHATVPASASATLAAPPSYPAPYPAAAPPPAAISPAPAPVASPPQPTAVAPAAVMPADPPAAVMSAAPPAAVLPAASPAAVAPAPLAPPVAPDPITAAPSRTPNEFAPPLEGTVAGVVHDLSAVGFPVAISSAALGRYDVQLTMEAAFAMLPMARALPLTPGSLVAVVGPGNRAVDVARSMATAIGMRDDEIAFVSSESNRRNLPRGGKFAPELVANDVRGVSDLAPGWRRGRVAVVAVSCPGLSGDHRVVRDLLGAMRPSATIAIADARSKSEDVAFFCDGLGGVDALVLDRVSETITPATLTATGIPVVRLGDAPATAEEWTRIAKSALRRRRGEVVES